MRRVFHPHKDPQQRLGDRVERYLVSLDAAAGVGEMSGGRTASTVPLPIVTIRHPNPPANFAERVEAAARTINLPGGLKPAGPNWLRLSGHNWDTSWRVLMHMSLILLS